MVRLTNEKDKLTACLCGEIDHHSAREIREEIDANLQRSLPKTLVLDFRDVTFMDSSGIGLVMGRYKLLKSMGGKIAIRGADSTVLRMIRLAGIEQLVEIEQEEK